MTSKQLINQLCYEYNTKNYNEERLKTTQEIKKDLDRLEKLEKENKELEILEIVKTHKLLNYVIKNEKCAKMYNLTEKEINKLKEWLENDK